MGTNKELLAALARYQFAVAAEATSRAAYTGSEWKEYGGVAKIKDVNDASEALLTALDRYVDERVRSALSSQDSGT